MARLPGPAVPLHRARSGTEFGAIGPLFRPVPMRPSTQSNEGAGVMPGGSLPGEDSVSVSGLVKIYNRSRAVDGVSFDVKKGEIFGIIGSNGSGKTTTVECLQGL